MKKLQKILVMTVLVAMMVGIGAIASSAAATMEPARTLALFDGSQTVSIDARGSMETVSEGTNSYYKFDFTTSGANSNFGSQTDFLGKGDYIVMEFDFMAEDWTTVKNILIGWNSRASNPSTALNDMHFNFSNEGGKPKITGNPLAGSITLTDSKPGQWHHFTMVVQIGGEHINKNGSCLTAVQGQDAVEAYAYIDGKLFAKNLIGDSKEFWSKDTTYFGSLRMTSSGDGQKMCMDNVRIVQYESNRDLREFFKYREKNGGAFPDINAVDYPFLAYDADYDYPLGEPTCKVVELNGTETMFDRFHKAAKLAASSSGAKIVLLADIADAVVNFPIKVDRAGYSLNCTVSPGLRAEETLVVNPITGALSNEISFIKKTKYAYFRWEIDHTGDIIDSRGYTPLAIGEPISYDGKEVGTSYYRDGILYTFSGQWRLNGEVYDTVPAFAANSYYTLTPIIESAEVLAIVESMDGTTAYACSGDEFISAVGAAGQDAVVTLLKDITMDKTMVIKSRVFLDLVGKTITSNSADGAIRLTDAAAGTVITSSVAGAKISADGTVFETACAFTFDGENILTAAAALLKVTDAATVRGLVINDGVFLLSGDTVLAVGENASLGAEIYATIVASNATFVTSSGSYALKVGGVLSGAYLSDSEASTVVLCKGLLLSGVSTFVGRLPAGVSLEDDSLAVVAKKVAGENGAATDYVVLDASEAVLLVWEEDAKEYVLPGQKAAYAYSDYYDAKKFYTAQNQYRFVLDGVETVGDFVDDGWVGQTVIVKPIYDSTSFYIVAAKPDGTFDVYVEATNLAELLSSGVYEEGTTFALGRKNMILENVVISTSYTVDLNGYGLLITGANKINAAQLTIMSTVAGASLYADTDPAFVLEADAALIVDDKNIASIGGTLEKEGE